MPDNIEEVVQEEPDVMNAEYNWNSETTTTEKTILAGTSLVNKAEGQPAISDIIRGEETFSINPSADLVQSIVMDATWYERYEEKPDRKFTVKYYEVADGEVGELLHTDTFLATLAGEAGYTVWEAPKKGAEPEVEAIKDWHDTIDPLEATVTLAPGAEENYPEASIDLYGTYESDK